MKTSTKKVIKVISIFLSIICILAIIMGVAVGVFIYNKYKKINYVELENIEVNEAKPVPEWLEKDNKKQEIKVLRLASREDVDLPVEEHLIVELYSK